MNSSELLRRARAMSAAYLELKAFLSERIVEGEVDLAIESSVEDDGRMRWLADDILFVNLSEDDVTTAGKLMDKYVETARAVRTIISENPGAFMDAAANTEGNDAD